MESYNRGNGQKGSLCDDRKRKNFHFQRIKDTSFLFSSGSINMAIAQHDKDAKVSFFFMGNGVYL
ncbi:MAG: hypothetical protein ACP5Q3_14370, partial [bacterium]